jgi:hypothetical protein
MNPLGRGIPHIHPEDVARTPCAVLAGTGCFTVSRISGFVWPRDPRRLWGVRDRSLARRQQILGSPLILLSLFRFAQRAGDAEL